MPPSGLASPNDNNGGWIVAGLDDCANTQDSSYRDLAAHKFAGYVSLPGVCSDFKFSASAACCRDISSNLNSSPNLFISAHLNNTLGESSSPQFLDSAAIALCVQMPGAQPIHFSQAAYDPDGDTITYSLGQPESGLNCGPGIPIAYSPGFTAANPIPSNTGFVLNPFSGEFTLSPSQQGVYVLKLEVHNYRWDTVTYTWISIGNAVRELMVPVTANCSNNAQFNNGLLIQNGTYTERNISSSQKDSIRNAYQVQNVYIDTGSTTHALKLLSGYHCFDTVIRLEFKSPIIKSSVTATDFRIFAPGAVSVPITSVSDTGNSLFTNYLDLHLYKPLVYNGNYLLQIRLGNDGNTIIGKCGVSIPQFSSLIIPINGCPVPDFELDQISVLEDEKITLQWSANSALQDSNVQKFFGSWNVFASENQGPWNLIHSLQSPAARNHTIDFGGSNYPVDHNNYEFFLDLRYAGENWGSSRSCETILLEANSSKDTGSNYEIDLTWNDYDCLDPNQRGYLIEYGHFFRVDSVVWLNSISTNLNQHLLSIPKSHGTGLYAIRVIAKDPQNQALPSQSNWIIFDSQTPIGLSENALNWQIPNILNPNGNGQNESFYIQNQSSTAQDVHISLKVFNQTGQLVFSDAQYHHRNTPANAWNGGSLSTGVYFYEIEFTGPAKGSQAPLQGKLLLVK
ncbi:T9SS type B sorting domain-containing protein [Croceimicrobium hydrocarbonivorans]|uniref:Gliding motility-associated C-terminal domain-containing protein n=1 Tax=Croceimicrobium hydrocarbonivorans TaxID=2761580 RepID=A0A7H0VJ19_9FLAO|nr:gliding motility-associated C-terminal domain-containing protein [Croceimicrobium hydrocarbonivorans]QNR25717.1 gliding motility-associated C-terminal domain-containing protein [Croceimicrobium hydrocarbonivorans]